MFHCNETPCPETEQLSPFFSFTGDQTRKCSRSPFSFLFHFMSFLCHVAVLTTPFWKFLRLDDFAVTFVPCGVLGFSGHLDGGIFEGV